MQIKNFQIDAFVGSWDKRWIIIFVMHFSLDSMEQFEFTLFSLFLWAWSSPNCRIGYDEDKARNKGKEPLEGLGGPMALVKMKISTYSVIGECFNQNECKIVFCYVWQIKS